MDFAFTFAEDMNSSFFETFYMIRLRLTFSGRLEKVARFTICF